MSEVDLDRLAAAYGFRADSGISDRIRTMLTTSEIGDANTVVDVGAGRGAQAQACRESGARVLAVDPTPAMVRVAHGDGLEGVLARGEALPFAAGSADLVYFHLSIHHGDWPRMLDEAYRITRPGGQVWVWTTTDRHHRASFLARWFPSVGEIDGRRFPRIAEVEEHMSLRCDLGDTVVLRDVLQRTASEWVAAVRSGFVSTLHLVDAAEIERGLAAFELAFPDPDLVIEYELEYAGVWCSRPPLQS